MNAFWAFYSGPDCILSALSGWILLTAPVRLSASEMAEELAGEIRSARGHTVKVGPGSVPQHLTRELSSLHGEVRQPLSPWILGCSHTDGKQANSWSHGKGHEWELLGRRP